MKDHIWPAGLESPQQTDTEMLHRRVHGEGVVAIGAEEVLRMGFPDDVVSLRALGEDGHGVTAKQSRNFDSERVYVCPCCSGAVHGDERNIVIGTQRLDVEDNHQHVHPTDTCFGEWLRRQAQIELIPFAQTTTNALKESREQPFRFRRRIPKEVIETAIHRSA